MPIYSLYHTWFDRIQQLWPQLRLTQKRNWAWLIVGIYQSRSVHLNKIAGKIPGHATLVSATRRLSRFLDNPVIRVRHLYEPVARQLLESGAAAGEIRLIIDTTRVGFAHQLLIAAIAYRKRALPIAWTWIPSKKGHSSAAKQRAMLAYIRRLVPTGVQVVLVGDTEFEAGEVRDELDVWGWQYVLRQKPNNQVQLEAQSVWQCFGEVVRQPGRSLWQAGARLTRKHARAVNVLAYWERGEKQPWLLATNLPCARAALRAYRRRMWIEEMFGDMKVHGFDLESTHLQHFLRLSRLTLAVAMLYVWLMVTGSRCVKSGRRYLVDRADRRDLSLFQIGWRIAERYLINSSPVAVRLRLCS